jgi:hypothetical protein
MENNPTNPGVSPEPNPTSDPVPTPPQPKSKRGLVIGLIVAGVVLFGAIAAAVVFFIVSSSPSNVLSSAVNRLLTAPQTNLTLDAVSSDSDSSLHFSLSADSSTQVTAIDGTISLADDDLQGDLSLKAYLEPDNYYFQVDGFSSLVKSASDTISSEDGVLVDAVLQPVAEHLDGKWVQATPGDFKELFADSDNQCLTDLLRGSAQTTPLTDADAARIWKEHPPLAIEQVSVPEDGLIPYTVTATDDSAAYLEALVQATTRLDFQSLTSCGDTSSDDTGDTEIQSATVYIGGDIFARELKKAVITTTDDTVITLEFGGASPSVARPDSATNVNDLVHDLQSSIIDAMVKAMAKQYAAIGYPLSDSDIQGLRDQLNQSLNVPDLLQQI